MKRKSEKKNSSTHDIKKIISHDKSFVRVSVFDEYNFSKPDFLFECDEKLSKKIMELLIT